MQTFCQFSLRSKLAAFAKTDIAKFMMVALVVFSMHPEMRAEMAQEYHQEMDNMKRDAALSRTPPWELAALDSNGDELYRTEYQESKEDAVQAAGELNSSDPETPDLPEDVARFEPVRTDE